MKSVNSRFRATVLALCPLLIVPSVRGQQTTPPPPPRRPAPSNQPSSPPQPNRNVESVNQRALDLEMLSTMGRRNADPEAYSRRLAAQLVQDIERLWQINAETIVPQSSAATVNYKSLSRATAEIKDRATRIKNIVGFPIEGKKGERVRYDAISSKLESLLPNLDRAIKSFFENPVFRVNSPNDAELRASAGRDLESIIKLSQTITKLAKSLGKSGPPNN